MEGWLCTHQTRLCGQLLSTCSVKVTVVSGCVDVTQLTDLLYGGWAFGWFLGVAVLNSAAVSHVHISRRPLSRSRSQL
jgi:hypothetical protein